MPEWIEARLEMVRAVVFYDRPLVWIGQDLKKERYLVFVIGDDDQGFPSKWLAVPLSPNIENLLSSKDISMYAAFMIGAEQQILEITDDPDYNVQTLRGKWRNVLLQDVDLDLIPEQKMFVI